MDDHKRTPVEDCPPIAIRGEPSPTDILAEAERYGLELSIFNEPTNKVDEGEITNGE